MLCYKCFNTMVRGVCRNCGRVARSSRRRSGVVRCGRCKGSGRLRDKFFEPTCHVCRGKGKVRI